MEHEGGEHPVEPGIGIREFLREAEIQAHREPLPRGLPPRAGERRGVRVEPDDIGGRMHPLGEEREVPRAATDLQNAPAGPHPRLFDKSSLVRPEAQQPRDRIVEKEHAAVPRARYVAPVPFFSRAHSFPFPRLRSTMFRYTDSITPAKNTEKTECSGVMQRSLVYPRGWRRCRGYRRNRDGHDEGGGQGRRRVAGLRLRGGARRAAGGRSEVPRRGAPR